MTNKEIVDYVMKTPRNTNPSVLNSLLQQRSGGSSVQPDWNQNDSTQADYIKNRPFYEKFGEVELFPATEILFPDEVSNIQLNGDLVEGNYTLYVGDMVINGAYEYFGYMPWYDYGLKFEDGTTYIWGDWNLSETLQNLNGAYTVRIVVNAVIVKQIDSKYIPEGKYIAYDRYQNLAEEDQDRARTNLGIFGQGEYTIFLEDSEDYSGTCDENGILSFTYNLEKPLADYGFDYLEATINFSGKYVGKACIIFPLPSSGENYLNAIVYYDGEQQVEVRIFNEKDINFIIRHINTNSDLNAALKDFRGLKTNFREKYV